MLKTIDNKNKKRPIRTEFSLSPPKHIRENVSGRRLQRINTEIVSNSKVNLRYDHNLYHKTIYHLKPLLDNPELFTMENSMSAKVFKKIKEWRPHNQKSIIPHPINFKRATNSMPRKEQWLREITLSHVTAKKWLIYSMQSGIIKGYKYRLQHDIASITKLLTFYTAYEIIKENYISINKFQIIVTPDDNKIGGTKLPLPDNEQILITLQDSLYSLLMGSANNMATAIASNLGNYVAKKRQNEYFSCFDVNPENREANINIFLDLMNKYAITMKLKQFTFMNVHGISSNLCSALDVAKIASECFKVPLFSKISSTRKYLLKSRQINSDGQIVNRVLLIENTNKLIGQGCIGGKTGSNKIGGDNFVGAFSEGYLVVVLGSSGKQQKFNDCMRLVEWVNNKISLSAL